MHFEFLLEEQSAEKVLHNLLPLIVTGEHSYKCICFQGKKNLLKNLLVELKGYSRWIPKHYRIVVLLDKDTDDCFKLKKTLNDLAEKAGLIIKPSSPKKSFQILNRIAIEELEAWFFGDPEAVRVAYPKLTSKFEMKAAYRNPDNIRNTWETLEKLLQNKGYFKTGLRKTEIANQISKFMQPLRNRSKSFQVFWSGITDCIQN